MRNGKLWKEKREYTLEKFSTMSGLMDFFVGTAIWGFLIVKYTSSAMENIRTVIPVDGFINTYLAYLFYGILTALLGMIISFIIHTIWRNINGSAKKF